MRCFRGSIFILAAALAAAACSDSITERRDATGDPAPFAYPVAPDRYESDNTPQTAGWLEVGEPQRRSIFPEGEDDWVRVELRGGTDYEFSASHLSVNGDTWLWLYDTDGATLLEQNDDCIGYDSCVRYTPPADGVYYLRVNAYFRQALMSYRLEARPFVDADRDGWSSFYDCDETDPEIHPKARDTAGDGIDQNCTGTDALAASLPDPFEDDDLPENAVPAVTALGQQYEFTLRPEFFPEAQRTLHDAEDADWYTVDIPPHQMVLFEVLSRSSPFSDEDDLGLTFAEVQPASGIRAVPGWGFPEPGAGGYIILANDTETAQTVPVRVSWAPDYAALTPFSYVAYAAPYGYDRDMDGYGTMGFWAEHDCDDNDPSVNDGAYDAPGDGIDRNCDGVDGDADAFNRALAPTARKMR